MADKAFQKFKKCRSEASQNSMKKAKNFNIDVKFLLCRPISNLEIISNRKKSHF